MASELLEEKRIASVYIDDVNFVAAEDLPTYLRARSEGQGSWATSTGRCSMPCPNRCRRRSVSERFGVDIDKALRSLHVLETTGKRSAAPPATGASGATRGATCPQSSKQEALDKAIITFLGAYGPASVDEVAFALGVSEDEVATALKALVAEEALDEGRFVVSELTQYMLKLDHLRLRAGGERMYDSAPSTSTGGQKSEGPFESIEQCVRFFGEMGMPLDIFRRVPRTASRSSRAAHQRQAPARQVPSWQGALCASRGRAVVRRRVSRSRA